MVSVSRRSFSIHVSIYDSFANVDPLMKHHPGYSVDNVIQVKLSKNGFIDLFKDSTQSTSAEQRYSSSRLLQRLRIFFSQHLDNYNNLASDISIIIQNSNSDIDINPVNLENACKSNNVEIFTYFFQSPVSFDKQHIQYKDSTADAYLYDDYHGPDESVAGAPYKVYEYIARELDNMISRYVTPLAMGTSYSTSSDDLDVYGQLDELFRIESDAFWDNVVIGDSVFIEGSFLLPNGNYVPIILQFVCTNLDVYGSPDPAGIQTIQNYLTLDSAYDISSYFM